MSLFLKEQAQLVLAVPELIWEGGRKTRAQRRNYDSYKIKVFKSVFPFKPYLYYMVGLLDFIRCQNPDLIVIYEEPVSLITFLVSRTARKMKIPLIGFSAENVMQSYPFPFSMFYRKNLQWADHFICVNSGAEKVLSERGVGAEKLSRVPLGVNPMLFNKSEDSRTEVFREQIHCKGYTVIGWVGRLNDQKNPLELIEAFERDEAIFLLIIGDGPQKAQLVRKLEREFPGRYRLISSVLPQDMPALYKICDLVAVTSRETATNREQFSRVVVEASACGIVTFFSDAGEMKDLFGTELCYGRGAAALRRKFLDWSGNAEIKEEYAALAAEISVKYSWRNAAEIEYELLRKFL